jgi:hypothetical protein
LSTKKIIDNDITTTTMANCSPCKEDVILHGPLYSFLSQYPHPHIGTLWHYYEDDGFKAPRRSRVFIEPILFTFFTASLILDSLMQVQRVDSQIRTDIATFIKRMKTVLTPILQMVNEHHPQKELFRSMSERTVHFGQEWAYQQDPSKEL